MQQIFASAKLGRDFFADQHGDAGDPSLPQINPKHTGKHGHSTGTSFDKNQKLSNLNLDT